MRISMLVCIVSLASNAWLGRLAWNLYREKSVEKGDSLSSIGLSCVYDSAAMKLYERKCFRDGAESLAALSNGKAYGDVTLLYGLPVPGDASRPRLRIALACWNRLFISYVIDDMGRCVSMLLQGKDSKLLYFPRADAAPVEFPHVDMPTFVRQRDVLRIVDGVNGER